MSSLWLFIVRFDVSAGHAVVLPFPAIVCRASKTALSHDRADVRSHCLRILHLHEVSNSSQTSCPIAPRFLLPWLLSRVFLRQYQGSRVAGGSGMPGGIAKEGQLNIYQQVSRIFGHPKFRNGQEEVIVVRQSSKVFVQCRLHCCLRDCHFLLLPCFVVSAVILCDSFPMSSHCCQRFSIRAAPIYR